MLRIQTTLCPSCRRNIPIADGVCYSCGSATSTSTFAEIEETPKMSIGQSFVLDALQRREMCRVLDQIERDTRSLVQSGAGRD